MKYYIFLLIIFLFISFTIGCTLPPFDEELSETINATEHMKKEAGIYEIQDLYDVDNDFYFIPSKSGLDKGFLITEKADRIIIQYIENNQALGSSEYEIQKQSSRTNNFYVNTIPVNVPILGNIDLLIFYRSFYYDPIVPVYPDFYYLYYDPATPFNIAINSNLNLKNDLDIAVPAVDPQYLLGASVTQFGSINYAAYLVKDSSNNYYEELWEFSVIGFPTKFNINNGLSIYSRNNDGVLFISLPDLPTDLENAFYYIDLINNPPIVTSFISFYDVDTESYLSYKWYYDGAIQLEQLNIPYKISAILSSGLIYCVNRNKAYLYDYNGNYQYLISIGDLKFKYEIWDSDKSEYRMIFTHPFWTQSDHQEYINFNIHSIATDDLSLLR